MKLFKIVLISLYIITIFSSTVFATSSEILSEGSSWMQLGKEKAGIGLDSGKLQSGSGKIYNTLLAVGTVVAVIVGAIIGIRIMFAGVEEKAKTKEILIPYIISCLVIFGSLGIWKISVNLVKEIL